MFFSYNSSMLMCTYPRLLILFREETDKVYFRKKDEVSDYAEFMFKAKILLAKK